MLALLLRRNHVYCWLFPVLPMFVRCNFETLARNPFQNSLSSLGRLLRYPPWTISAAHWLARRDSFRWSTCRPAGSRCLGHPNPIAPRRSQATGRQMWGVCQNHMKFYWKLRRIHHGSSIRCCLFCISFSHHPYAPCMEYLPLFTHIYAKIAQFWRLFIYQHHFVCIWVKWSMQCGAPKIALSGFISTRSMVFASSLKFDGRGWAIPFL